MKQEKTPNKSKTETTRQKTKPVMRILLVTLLVVVALAALPNLMGWAEGGVSIGTIFLRCLAFSIVLIVGAMMASLAFNKDSDKLNIFCRNNSL